MRLKKPDDLLGCRDKPQHGSTRPLVIDGYTCGKCALRVTRPGMKSSIVPIGANVPPCPRCNTYLVSFEKTHVTACTRPRSGATSFGEDTKIVTLRTLVPDMELHRESAILKSAHNDALKPPTVTNDKLLRTRFPAHSR